MRVFVGGASGAIGTRLVPQLIERGHEVIGTFRSPGERRACGRSARSRSRSTCSTRARCARPSLEGRARRDRPPGDGAGRCAASRATWTAPSRRPTGCGPRAPTRCWPPRARPACAGSSPRASPATGMRARAARSRPRTTRSTRPRRPGTRETNAAMRHLDQAVTDAGGIALRYGGFYGAANDGLVAPVRKRSSRSSATAAASPRSSTSTTPLRRPCSRSSTTAPAIYNVVDDEPAPVREWLPVLADALGAKPPRHVPRWLARLIAGEAGVDDGHRGPRRLEREGQARARAGRCATRAGARASRPPTRGAGHAREPRASARRQRWHSCWTTMTGVARTTTTAIRPTSGAIRPTPAISPRPEPR